MVGGGDPLLPEILGQPAFIGLTIHVKIIGGDVPFYLKFWVKVTALQAKSPIFDLFSLVAPQP